MRKALPVLCGCLILATAFAVAQPYMGFSNKPVTGSQTKVASNAQDFSSAVNAASKQYSDQINQQLADQFKAAQAAQAAAQAAAQTQTTQNPAAQTTVATPTAVSPAQPSALPRPTTPTSAPVTPNYSITNTPAQTINNAGGANRPAPTNSSIYTGFGGGTSNTVTTPPGQTNSNGGSNWNIKY